MNWRFGLIGCQIYYLTDMIGMIGSVYSLVFLSVGRCVMITFKRQKYLKFLKNIRYVIIAMVWIWIAGFIFSLPGLLSIKIDQSVKGAYACGSYWNEHKANKFFIIKFVFIFVIPIFVVLISSVKLLMFLRENRKVLYLSQKSTIIKYTSSNNESGRKEKVSILNSKINDVQKKAVNMILIIVILFLIQWTPIWAFEIVFTQNSEYIQLANIMATVFSHSNSISNPLIYIIFSHKFPIFDCLKKLFSCSQRPIVV